MSQDLQPLILDLVEWVEKRPRRYAEVMEAWRTSCPRLPVWEDAVDKGFLVRQRRAGQGAMVVATPRGRRFLSENGRLPTRDQGHDAITDAPDAEPAPPSGR